MDGVPAAVLRGSEHILVIDDENFVALALRNGLERLGYTVHTHLRERSTRYLQRILRVTMRLCTDFTMPFMTGDGTRLAVSNTRPELPFVLISGYGQLLSPAELTRAGVDACINKPFIPKKWQPPCANSHNASRFPAIPGDSRNSVPHAHLDTLPLSVMLSIPATAT